MDKPTTVWVCDIAYIRTNEGCLYLAVVIGFYSGQVVGWQIESRMHDALMCSTLQAALAMRGNPKSVTVHSDQASQYVHWHLDVY